MSSKMRVEPLFEHVDRSKSVAMFRVLVICVSKPTVYDVYYFC